MSIFSFLADIFSPLTWLVNLVGDAFSPNTSGGTTVLAPPELPKELPPPPTVSDKRVRLARTVERRRARLVGRQSTILTRGLGLLDEPNTTNRTLLGTT